MAGSSCAVGTRMLFCGAMAAEHGRRVEIGEENQDVVLAGDCRSRYSMQRRAPRALLLQPLHLVLARVLVVEDPLRVAVEGVDVARLRVGKPADRDAADAVGALRVLVLPGDVVLRAGGQHFDLVPRREPFGDQAAVILGSAEDLGAVTLDDEGDLQLRQNLDPEVSCRLKLG